MNISYHYSGRTYSHNAICGCQTLYWDHNTCSLLNEWTRTCSKTAYLRNMPTLRFIEKGESVTHKVLWSRDEREWLFQSHSLPFPTVHSHSHSRASRLSQVLFPYHSQSHRLFPVPPAASPILLSHRTVVVFMDTMIQITNKQTTTRSL